MNKLNDITVTEIIDIETINSPKGQTAQINGRLSMGLSFCKKGKIVYEHKGNKFVSDGGCAIMLPQDATYELYRTETGSFPLINFYCENFAPETFMVIKIKNSESYIRDFEKMYRLSLFAGNRTAVMSIFYDILYRLQSENDSVGNILTPAILEIEENFNNINITNGYLAELCGISEVYFRKLFLSQKGITPRQYILDIRIRRAKQLLSHGGYSVETVSETVGFSSVYHFCRTFKEKTGMTPTEYARYSAKKNLQL